ncbi:MAG: hypothetical protein KDI06_14780 [Calditrichaeota bacterium]|nr:hypothetical protein [Calditrichota bacterium]HQU72921.1 hypothetical protein [Calditrichia bacterium]
MDFLQQITWRPGIGDPTFMGWLTVFVYFLTALLAAMMAWRNHHKGEEGTQEAGLFWGGLALLLVFLGINKQLDLQTLLTDIGRALALSQGWYEGRRGIQLLFVLGLIFAGFKASKWLKKRFTTIRRENPYALLGLAFLGTFVVIRAVSFHLIDHIIDLAPLGIRLNWVLELTGLFCIDFSAIRHLLGR